MKSAESALEIAKLNMGYTEIASPINGRISRAEITIGNLIDAQINVPTLATIVSQDPIYAGFEIDEQAYLQLISAGGHNSAINIPVKVSLATDTAGEFEGIIQSIDNALNTQTGTIRVRAILPNKESKLVPGLFAKVKVGSAAPQNVLLISDRAVGTDQNKKFVMVVGSDNTAQYREVTLSTAADGLRIVNSGLKEGESVIVNGLQHARPGAPVTPTTVPMDPNDAPPATITPKKEG